MTTADPVCNGLALSCARILLDENAVTVRDTLQTDAIEQALAPLRLGTSSSELHGAMTGFLCAGGKPGAQGWLDTLQLEGADAAQAEQADRQLATLGEVTATQIRPGNANLELLLPPAGDDLEARALGLVDWCRGFLGGIGLGGINQDGLDPGMAAVLRDFSDIATTVPQLSERDEDQAALDELIDHVRFGALLLHARLTVPEGVSRQ